jgi:hypothetical protein
VQFAPKIIVSAAPYTGQICPFLRWIHYSNVLPVFRSEFGRPPAGDDGIFDEFEQDAIASVSVAQVCTPRKAQEWVAVECTSRRDVESKTAYSISPFILPLVRVISPDFLVYLFTNASTVI